MTLVIDVDGSAAGSATLFDFDLLARHAEAGINLERNARGRGIGTAAIIQLVEFGFVRHNLHRVHLQAISSNVAAIRAYEKAGFVIEGRQRQHAWVRGAYAAIRPVMADERTAASFSTAELEDMTRCAGGRDRYVVGNVVNPISGKQSDHDFFVYGDRWAIACQSAAAQKGVAEITGGDKAP